MSDKATCEKLREWERQMRTYRESLEGKTAAALITSKIDEMPTGEPNRDNWPAGWINWATLTDVYGITIHHTMSHSPIATAKYCVKGKGYPSIQYHFWVSANDNCDVWQVADLADALWHDHTGSHADGRGTIAVGLAGSLHTKKPPEQQLMKAASLVVWLMKEYTIPRNEVRGHQGRAAEAGYDTVCPGWHVARWRNDWEGTLDDALLAANEAQ